MSIDNKIRYTFSGHESFYCKSLWLKKGYDFISENKDFNAPDAVVKLGVGKNMVASIRYWLRAFGLIEDGHATEIADYIFNDENGKDPYIEDLGTLWLLHYLLVKTELASIYKLFFVDFHKEKNNEFSREKMLSFLKRKSFETDYSNLYNENTVKRDIGVLLQNYAIPEEDKPNEDFSALLIDLNLIRQTDNKTYYFNVRGKNELTSEILLYAILDWKGNDKTVDYEAMVDYFGGIFCLTSAELIDVLLVLTEKYHDSLVFADDGGIKQLLFIKELDKQVILNSYYNKI
ncbi:hypothetical protein EZS27_008328 [termite gut metagenome]|jgi:hypothetical protein|uniref:DUF4007 domain-containing protein n=1 Tax=termite gut metagenome TaxID=433724 RepID=A0A5J4SCZ0_9ZZZZ